MALASLHALPDCHSQLPHRGTLQVPFSLGQHVSLTGSQSDFGVEGVGMVISAREVIQRTLLVIIKYQSFKMISFYKIV